MNKIQFIEVDGIRHSSHAGKTAALTKYYSDLLGHSPPTTWDFDLAHLYADSARAFANQLLAPVTASEARAAVRSMNAASAPGPDGFGPSFYNVAWSEVGSDVMAFLHAFHHRSAELDRVNRVHIVLLPKRPGATEPSTFRPISLQNCPMKIASKMMTTRHQRQISNLIDIDQTGFIHGRSISENFILTTELV